MMSWNRRWWWGKKFASKRFNPLDVGFRWGWRWRRWCRWFRRFWVWSWKFLSSVILQFLILFSMIERERSWNLIPVHDPSFTTFIPCDRHDEFVECPLHWLLRESVTDRGWRGLLLQDSTKVDLQKDGKRRGKNWTFGHKWNENATSLFYC